jgi:hypothetical protein
MGAAEPALELVEEAARTGLPAPPALVLPLMPEPGPGPGPWAPEADSGPVLADAPPPEAALALAEPSDESLLLVGTLAMGAGFAGMAAVPGWRRALLRGLTLGTLSLFSRLNEARLFDHPARSEIHEFVRHNQGERLEVVRRSLGMSNGTMLHHVRILIDHDVLRLHREGAMARLYLAGPRVPASPYLPVLRKRILALLRGTPGVSQREIAMSVGVSERVVSYHVGALKSQGLLAVERAGVANRCFAAPSVQAV